MSALTSLLVRDDAVSVRQIEDALQRQIMDGGELDTALLELGALPENVLIAYRAASEHGVAAGREEVMGASSATRVLLPADKALALRVTPLLHDATSLTVATCRPLSVAEMGELADATGLMIEQRITSELRVAAALERFYGVPMSPRLAALLARVDSLAPGEIRTVEPLLESPSSEHAQPLPDFEESEDFEAALSAAFERASGAPSSGPPPARKSDPTENGPTRPLGGPKRKRRRSSQPTAAADVTLRPSERPARAAVAEPKPAASPALSSTRNPPVQRKPAVRLPQGPLTAASAEEALNAAEERDAVMEICFRFARQYFDTTVVLNIKDERAVGAMAHNASALVDVREVSVPILRGGSMDDLMRSLLPRVVDLSRKDEDRVLSLSLKRLSAQPAALLPICIKRRVVSILYGDRGGDMLYVDELSELLALMQHVSRAFERIIRTRKALGLTNTGTPAAFRDLSHAPTQRSLVVPQVPKLGEDPSTAVLDARTQRALEALGVGRPAPSPPAPRASIEPATSRAPRASGEGAVSREAAEPATSRAPRVPIESAASSESTASFLSRAPRGAADSGTARTAGEPAHEEPPTSRNSRVPPGPATSRTSRHPAEPATSRVAAESSRAAPEPEHDSDIYATARIAITPLPLEQFDTPRYLSKPPPGTGRYQSLLPPEGAAVDDLTQRPGSGDSTPRVAAETSARQEREDDTQRIRTQRKSGRPRYGRSQPPRARASVPPPAVSPPSSVSSSIGRASLHASKPAPGTGAYHSSGLTTEMISLPQARVPEVESGSSAQALAAAAQPIAAEPAPVVMPKAAPLPPRTAEPAMPKAAPLQPQAAEPAMPKAGPFRSQNAEPGRISVPRVSPTRVDTEPFPGMPQAPAPQAANQNDALAPDDSIPITLAPPEPAAPDPKKELEPRLAALLARKVEEDPSAEVQAVHALGEPALQALLAKFPGPLWFDRRRPHVRVPFGRDISPVARALETFGEAGLARFAPLLRVPDVEGRYYATLFACDRVHPALLEPLLERLFDEDAQIRLLVRDVLPHYRRLPGFEPVAERLCAQALSGEAPLRSRLAAIDAIGVLRDAASVPTLIELSAHTDKQISVPSLRALTAITCQDFGKTTKKWRAWYEANAYRHRVEWLIEGLMHSDQNLRASAGLELQKLTQVYYGYVAAASKRERELAQKRYWDWWRTEGRRKF